MLRLLFFIGLVLVLGSTVLGIVLGMLGTVLGFAVKVLVLGAIAYIAIRIISPRTADYLRSRVENETLPRP